MTEAAGARRSARLSCATGSPFDRDPFVLSKDERLARVRKETGIKLE